MLNLITAAITEDAQLEGIPQYKEKTPSGVEKPETSTSRRGRSKNDEVSPTPEEESSTTLKRNVVQEVAERPSEPPPICPEEMRDVETEEPTVEVKKEPKTEIAKAAEEKESSNEPEAKEEVKGNSFIFIYTIKLLGKLLLIN